MRTVFNGVAQGVMHIHQEGHFHADVKPANILLGCNGETKLTDFDTVKKKMDTDFIVGTAQYLMPEARDGRQCLKTDVGQLALTLYYVLTGTTPMTTKVESFGVLFAVQQLLECTYRGATLPKNACVKHYDTWNGIVKDGLNLNPKKRPKLEVLAKRIDDAFVKEIEDQE